MKEDKYKLVESIVGPERVKYDEPLKFHTYNQKKGKAQAFYITTNLKELINILNLLTQLKLPFLMLGAGTKIVEGDQDINKFVIKNRTGNIKVAAVKGKVSISGIGLEEALIEVESGVSISKLNNFLAEQNLQQISGFSSTISTIGGAIFYDQFLQDQVQKITVWSDSQIEEIKLEELSITQHVVLSCVFRFKVA